MSGLRQSSMTIEKFCRGLRLEILSFEQTAILLCLAHLSGWAAERISNKILALYGTSVTPEQIWDFHAKWLLNRNGDDKFNLEEKDLAEFLFLDAGIALAPIPGVKPEYLGRSLNKTVKPTTVRFRVPWSSDFMKPGSEPFCPGFGRKAHEETRAWLLSQNEKQWAKLSPREEIVLNQFGSRTVSIIQRTLTQWEKEFQIKLQEVRPFRPYNDREFVIFITEHTGVFHFEYERCFGHLERSGKSVWEKREKKETTYLDSTGHGIRILLALMMIDRFYVARWEREMKRAAAQFIETDITTVNEEDRICSICREEMGFLSPEGNGEICIELVICCGQYVGATCLKEWLNTKDNWSLKCPHCRYELPLSFLAKLLYHGSADEDRSENGDEVAFFPGEVQQVPVQHGQLVQLGAPGNDDDFQLEG